MSLDATAALAEPVASPSAPESASAPAPEAAAPAAKAAPAAEETSLEEDLARVYRQATRERDNSGRFVGKDKPESTPEAAAVEPKLEPKLETATKPETTPPATWTAEQRAVWDKLSPEAQTLVAAREQELHAVKSDFGRLQPVKQVLDDFGGYLQAVGKPAPQFLRQVLAASHALDTNPARTIKQLADLYGVNLGEIWDPSAPTPDPEVIRLRHENERLRSQNEQSAEQQQAAAEAARLDTMEKLVSDFGGKHPEIKTPEVQNELAVQIRALQAHDPKMEPSDVLAQAYERASWVVQSTRDARLKAHVDTAERARVEAAKKAAEAAANAGAINVNGAVRSNGSGDDLDADLRRIWRKNANR